jgi:hypothetical protein
MRQRARAGDRNRKKRGNREEDLRRVLSILIDLVYTLTIEVVGENRYNKR